MNLAGQLDKRNLIKNRIKRLDFINNYMEGSAPHRLPIAKIYPRNGQAKEMCPAVQLTSDLWNNNIFWYIHMKRQ